MLSSTNQCCTPMLSLTADEKETCAKTLTLLSLPIETKGFTSQGVDAAALLAIALGHLEYTQSSLYTLSIDIAGLLAPMPRASIYS